MAEAFFAKNGMSESDSNPGTPGADPPSPHHLQQQQYMSQQMQAPPPQQQLQQQQQQQQQQQRPKPKTATQANHVTSAAVNPHHAYTAATSAPPTATSLMSPSGHAVYTSSQPPMPSSFSTPSPPVAAGVSSTTATATTASTGGNAGAAVKRPQQSMNVPSPLGPSASLAPAAAAAAAAAVAGQGMPAMKKVKSLTPGTPLPPALAQPQAQQVKNAAGVSIVRKPYAPVTHFLEELPAMMYGFGDAKAPYKETVELVDELVVQFVTTVVHKALAGGTRRTGLNAETIRGVFRQDSKKWHRIKELVSTQKLIEKAKETHAKENPTQRAGDRR